MSIDSRRAKWSPEYTAYHAKVVTACVERFSGHEDPDYIRRFFDEQCDFLEEFRDNVSVEECADNQYDACT